MARPEKVEFVGGVAEKLRKSQSVVLADFCGLTVAQMTNLRAQLRKDGIELRVIKNRLGKLALAGAGCDKLDEFLKGNTAWAFGIADPVAPAKILVAFAKANEKLVLKGGLLEKKRLDAAGVRALAMMPGRKELLSMMAGGFKQPAGKMARVMQAGLTKIAYAMNALAEKKQQAGEAA